MRQQSREGNLAATPLAGVLLSLWENKSSGRLWLKNADAEKTIYLYKGNLALTDSCLPEKEFQTGLVEKSLLPSQRAEEILQLARASEISFARALIEQQVLGPAQTWELMAEFWLDSLFPLFDWPQGQYIFDDSGEPPASQILMIIASLEVILQGVRRMSNFRLIEAALPAPFEILQVLSPGHAEILRLAPHEKYLLHLVRSGLKLEDLYEKSQLGKRETQKALFGMLQLGLVGPTQGRNKVRPTPEFSLGETEKIWTDFNDKCSYIYKYISKEIGPVGLNVLEKALDEVKRCFGPPLQNLELRPDGRIEIKPMPFLSFNLLPEESRQFFLRLLNEILVAEVLSVKKTLGNEHEAAIVRALERIGEGN